MTSEEFLSRDNVASVAPLLRHVACCVPQVSCGYRSHFGVNTPGQSNVMCQRLNRPLESINSVLERPGWGTKASSRTERGGM